MPRRATIVSIIAGGAMGLPLLAFGHGAEFLDAKFYFDDQGRANLEVTADYAGNPMISSEQEARAALANALSISVDATDHQLADLAPLKLEARSQPDPESPSPRGPEDPQIEHKLLTAVWRWRPSGRLLQFSVPRSSAQTVLFWMKEPHVQPPRWSMLIPQDRTPVISVPVIRNSGPLNFSTALIVDVSPWWLVLLVFPFGGWWWWRWRARSA